MTERSDKEASSLYENQELEMQIEELLNNPDFSLIYPQEEGEDAGRGGVTGGSGDIGVAEVSGRDGASGGARLAGRDGATGDNGGGEATGGAGPAGVAGPGGVNRAEGAEHQDGSPDVECGLNLKSCQSTSVCKESPNLEIDPNKSKMICCPHCGVSRFKRAWFLTRHISQMHLGSIKCGICDNVFLDKFHYLKHSKTCFYWCKMDGCSVHDKRKSRVESHERTHQREA